MYETENREVSLKHKSGGGRQDVVRPAVSRVCQRGLLLVVFPHKILLPNKQVSVCNAVPCEGSLLVKSKCSGEFHLQISGDDTCLGLLQHPLLQDHLTLKVF